MLLPLASKVPNNGFQRRTNHGLSAGGPSWHNCRPATSSLLGYPGVLGGRNVEVEIPPVLGEIRGRSGGDPGRSGEIRLSAG